MESLNAQRERERRNELALARRAAETPEHRYARLLRSREACVVSGEFKKKYIWTYAHAPFLTHSFISTTLIHRQTHAEEWVKLHTFEHSIHRADPGEVGRGHGYSVEREGDTITMMKIHWNDRFVFN